MRRLALVVVLVVVASCTPARVEVDPVPATYPPHGDCSGELPTDPCIIVPGG